MLKFVVYENGELATQWTLRNAYVMGADDVGVRASVKFEKGVITCDKATIGPAALALQFEVEEIGDLMLQTCLLPERDEPYLLTLELARHRLMRVISKQEDWAMFDLPDESPAKRRINIAKKRFIDALCKIDTPAEADRLSREALAASIDAAEELALNHADAMIVRRLNSGQVSKYNCGVGVALTQSAEKLGPTMVGAFDFVRLATPWKLLEPSEQEYNWAPLDAWCEFAFRNRVPIIGGPLVSFTPSSIPDWLYIWEHDYDTVRDLLYEHIERVVTRYRNVVSIWNVVSGIHVNKHFTFNFEQLMDLTRMSVMLTKKVHPQARTLIEITHPFGEYYSTNQRSIPPLMYAEMIVQAGIPFEAFGVRVLMGQGDGAQSVRDLMQVSALLDRFNGLGKPVHVTAVGVPSEPAPANATGPDGKPLPTAGYWRKPWSTLVQERWLEALYKVALSKPFVEAVAWHDLADHEDSDLPSGGLLKSNGQPKSAFRRMASLRKSINEGPGN
jgi:hypothetical protein